MRSMRTVAMSIEVGDATLEGELTVVSRGRGVVVFIDALDRQGFDRPRARTVAAALARQGIAPLLVDLVPRAERARRPQGPSVDDLPALAVRLCRATEWAIRTPEVGGHPIGFFGLGTGAAVALQAAALRPDLVAAIVCGDLDVSPGQAGNALPRVEAPTLVIAEGADEVALAGDREALRRMHAFHAELAVVPGVKSLGEPAAASAVTAVAVSWFERHLVEAMSDAEGIEAV